MNEYLEQLKAEVDAELADEKYEGRSHFSRNLYAEGCHGPLCTYRERLKAARLYAQANPERKPRTKKPEALARDEYLDSVLVALHGHVPSELRVPA